MSDDKVPKRRFGALESLYEFLEGPEEDVTTMLLERILKELERENLDPAPLVRMVRERLTAARAAEDIARARQERTRIDRLRSQGSETKPTGDLRDRARLIMEGLSGPQRQLAAAYYRKFEEATESDLESMLRDLELLERMSQNDDDEQ